jgi:Ca2+/Na+ antiporter
MPYINAINGILEEVKGWLFALVGIITVVVIIIQGIKYQSGDSAEKQEAIRHIRNSIMMGGGVFFLVWLATFIIDRMSNV